MPIRKIIISESQLKKIKLHEIMDTRMVFPKLGVTVDDVLGNVVQCGGYDGLYPGSEDDTEDGNGFYPFDNKEQMLSKVYKICSEFEQFDNPIPVWRSVRVDSLSDIKYGDVIGNSWTFDHKSAIHFAASIWGNTGNTLLKAECPFDAVDWVETISRYIQDNTDGSNFNEGFSENELYVEYPNKLLNVEVDRTTVKEGKDTLQLLIEEKMLLTERTIDWTIPYIKGKLYQFQPLTDTRKTPDNAVKSFTPSICSKNKEITEYLNKNGEPVWYYKPSSSEGSSSEYYLTKLGAPPGMKRVIRKSDHYTYYVFPRFEVSHILLGKEFVNCIFGTQKPIPGINLFYTYKLPEKYTKKITNEMVVEAMEMRDPTTGERSHTYVDKSSGRRFVILDRLSLGILDSVNLWGEVIIPEDDHFVFTGL